VDVFAAFKQPLLLRGIIRRFTAQSRELTMNDYSYGWEKLHTAVSSLAGESSQRQRLVNAILYSLVHIRPDENLPPSIRDEFKAFIKEMTATEAEGDEGTVQATVNSMEDFDIHRAVERIIGFYDTVCRHRDPT
jgi:hypothetical protein